MRTNLSICFAPSADPLYAALALLSDTGVGLIKRVAVLTLRLSSVHHKAKANAAVQILSLRHGFQVLWIHADRGTAEVVNHVTGWDGGNGQGVGEAVSKPSLHILAASNAELSVAGRGHGTLPGPAGISPTTPVSLRPEAVFGRALHQLRPEVRLGVTVPQASLVVHTAQSSRLSRLDTTVNEAAR